MLKCFALLALNVCFITLLKNTSKHSGELQFWIRDRDKCTAPEIGQGKECNKPENCIVLGNRVS